MAGDDWRPREMPALLVARAARLLARADDERLRAVGLSVAQVPVLAALKDGARRNQAELARLCGVEQPSMAQLLARMARDGLVRREPDPADARSGLLSLTPRAEALLEPGRDALRRGNADALRGFSEAEAAALAGLLRRVLANLDGGGDAPA